jgi:hypothetical protein
VQFNRLAGLAGVLPHGIEDLLSLGGSSRKEVESLRSTLRATLIAGMVRIVTHYQGQLGAYLAHAAPRDFLQYSTIDSRCYAQRVAAQSQLPRGDSANSGPARCTRSSITGRRPARYSFDMNLHSGLWIGSPDEDDISCSYLVNVRWQAVLLIARSWHARLPPPGPCHVHALL